MALANWLAELATQLEGSGMNRQAAVNMESGNQGAYSAPQSQLTEMDYAVNPKLESVTQNPEIKQWEQSNMESDTQKTQSRVEELIRFRENEAKKDSNIEGQYATPKAKHQVANQSGRKAYSRLEMAKLARAASGDVLDSIEEIMDDAESFVQKHVPLGQREQVFAAITKALNKNGIDVRFTVMAKSEAPQSGFDHYTMNEVASFIEDDYRTVPDSWNMSMPEGNSNHNPTSIQRVVTKNPTVESVRSAKSSARKSLAASLTPIESQLRKSLAAAKTTTERKVAKQLLANYTSLVKRYAMDDEMMAGPSDDMAEDSMDSGMDQTPGDFEADDMAMEEEHAEMADSVADQLEALKSRVDESIASELDSIIEQARALESGEEAEMDEMADESTDEFADESDDEFADDDMDDDMSADEPMAPMASRKNRFVRGR